jgi:hypothetical protein
LLISNRLRGFRPIFRKRRHLDARPEQVTNRLRFACDGRRWLGRGRTVASVTAGGGIAGPLPDAILGHLSGSLPERYCYEEPVGRPKMFCPVLKMTGPASRNVQSTNVTPCNTRYFIDENGGEINSTSSLRALDRAFEHLRAPEPTAIACDLTVGDVRWRPNTECCIFLI